MTMTALDGEYDGDDNSVKRRLRQQRSWTMTTALDDDCDGHDTKWGLQRRRHCLVTTTITTLNRDCDGDGTGQQL
ncbi:unnamed protein product [Sphagnum balticum]